MPAATASGDKNEKEFHLGVDAQFIALKAVLGCFIAIKVKWLGKINFSFIAFLRRSIATVDCGAIFGSVEDEWKDTKLFL